MPRVRFIKIKDKPERLSDFPNFHSTGSVSGMKRKFYGMAALLVRCGSYIYDVSAAPEIYRDLAY